VAYINSFITYMVGYQRADSARIYLLGDSNGAMMAWRFACQAPGRASAIVAVSGPLMLDTCPYARGLRALYIQGQDDQNVPVAGGIGQDSITKIYYRSVADTTRIMTAAGAKVTVQLIPNVGHSLTDIRNADNLPQTAAQFLLGR
jgi:polyhydroxybutyrate depolymerase